MVFNPQFGVQPVYKGKTYLKCVDVLCCLYIIANKNLLLAPALTLQMAKSSTHFFWLFTHSVTTVALNCNNITSGTQVKKKQREKKQCRQEKCRSVEGPCGLQFGCSFIVSGASIDWLRSRRTLPEPSCTPRRS